MIHIYTINILLGSPGDQVRPRGFAQHRGRRRRPRGGEFLSFRLGDSPRKPRGKWENPMEIMGKTLGKATFFAGKCGKSYGKSLIE